MNIVRRFIVLGALAFWQGGFAFYAAVVVPVGQDVLGSHVQQGFVTRRVTNYLNLAGVVATALLMWDLYATRRIIDARQLRILAWIGMALSLLFQAWLHGRLDGLLDQTQLDVLDHDRFYAEHRWYLLSSTGQMLCCLGFVAATIHVWRCQDEQRAKSSERSNRE